MNESMPDLFSALSEPDSRSPVPVSEEPEGFSQDAGESDLLADLNDAQYEAVVHTGGPVLVVAGAGSGKTRVLTRRIAYLVAERNVHPRSILAITFTNKAAAEMKSRVEDLIGRRAKMMWVSTFHSSCVRILRNEIDALGYKKSFSIYDDIDAKRLLTLITKEMGIDQKRHSARMIMNWISNCKNELQTPAQAAENAPTYGSAKIYAEVYREYQKRLRAANSLDFDDLIMVTVQLLRKFPQVREKYRRRFRQVLVDEYQDTNYAQYCLIKELCGELSQPTSISEPLSLAESASDESASASEVASIPELAPETELTAEQVFVHEPIPAPELMVVGDSDQSIYAFRGATIRNILDFEKDFPGAKTILLEQNYRSTQNILNAANAVIKQNPKRPEKRLWSDAGEGEKLVGWVGDTEQDEARFVAEEIVSLVDQGKGKYCDVAVFYRTNAQSRAFEDVFIRVGVPYIVVGGVRFYERKEVKDAIAYLRAISNPDDDVSVRRILNVPKRGIGERAESAVAELANSEGESFYTALTHAQDAPGIATRSLNRIAEFVEIIEAGRAQVAEDVPADQILSDVLKSSGYLKALEESTDPQDETRIENLTELVNVAAEFVARAHALELDQDEIGVDDLGLEVADASLSAFLEQVSLVADSDQIPDPEGQGVVTLMTLHTAKGLEFDTVFLTGMEDGIFPHSRSMDNFKELEEERRLAYVGVTRARKRLYLTRSAVRSVWGMPQYNPQSRFIGEIPSKLVDWRRTGEEASAWAQAPSRAVGARKTSGTKTSGSVFGSGVAGSLKKSQPTLSSVAKGDRVLHTSFGLGTVKAVIETGGDTKADIDFGSEGVRRLVLKYAPMEKL